MTEPDQTSFWRKEIPLWRKPKPKDDEVTEVEDSQPPADDPPPARGGEPAAELGRSPTLGDNDDFFGSGLRTRLGPGGQNDNGAPSQSPHPDVSGADADEPWEDLVPDPPRAEQLPPTLAATAEDEVRMHQLIAALAERDATLIELGAQLEEREAQLAETEAKLSRLDLGLPEEQAAADDRPEQRTPVEPEDLFSRLEQAVPAAEEHAAQRPAPDESPAEELRRAAPAGGGARAPETLERLVSEMAQMLGDDPAGRSSLPGDSASEPAQDLAAEATARDDGAGRLPDLRQGPRWRIEHGQQQAESSLALVVSYGEGLELRFTGQSALFVERLLRATEQLQALGEMLRPGEGEGTGEPQPVPKPATGDDGADGGRRQG